MIVSISSGSPNRGAGVDGGRPSMTLSKERGSGGTVSFPYLSILPENVGIMSCMTRLLSRAMTLNSELVSMSMQFGMMDRSRKTSI